MGLLSSVGKKVGRKFLASESLGEPTPKVSALVGLDWEYGEVCIALGVEPQSRTC